MVIDTVRIVSESIAATFLSKIQHIAIIHGVNVVGIIHNAACIWSKHKFREAGRLKEVFS